MTEFGQELRLGAARALGIVAGTQQFGLVRLAVGDFAGDGNKARNAIAFRPAAHLDPNILGPGRPALTGGCGIRPRRARCRQAHATRR
jgi:hypothetical protein